MREAAMTVWNRFKILKLMIQLIFNPNRTDLIFKGVDIVSQDPHHKAVKDIEAVVMANNEFKTMYDQNYVPTAPLLENLARCPTDSFGRAVYDHMHSNGLTFDLFPRLESRRPVHYLSTRIYQDHDLWHVLLGYGVKVDDELAIQAFGVAQFQSPIAIMLVAGGLIHLLVKNPPDAIAAFKKVNEGYALGRRIPFLLTARLHDYFARPLKELRAQWGIA
jgi:ubiquinone biosynthesis protein Coq4